MSGAVPPEPLRRATARALIDVGAIEMQIDRPFLMSSGLAAPVFVDCRRLISHPSARQVVIEGLAETLARRTRDIESVAGGETAGIPFAAWVAQTAGLPMHYVRKRPRGLGPHAQVEGRVRPGQRVALIEDMTVDGSSKLRFAEALRRAGAEVTDALVIFLYDALPGAADALADKGLRLHHLASWQDVIAVAEEDGSFPAAALATLKEFLADPAAWSGANGGSPAPRHPLTIGSAKPERD
ncbi:orotate phosphoribosyltransferase [Mesobaculum littorinae]|uniref:Orotate phosphoribosyltransferase n=1 Tax=Mesobaculum littorinae TaxID=2486419 RepID=A0A438AFB0_9RHOB|nr:orotate phosphoribosyltransferase [Mesobaculum littorinae]RVV97394.1 orotate phosphoribosyltransferase [Mesobaculum littorinae]